ncbi:MAG: hypothetical protein RQ743_14330 [Bacteroidales bacterium]|nr:hypothetical protein [Bacteroidales bacterium]
MKTDDSADPETAKERAGMYYLDGGHLELTTDDTRLVAKLTAGYCFGFTLLEHGRLSGFFNPASVRYYRIC